MAAARCDFLFFVASKSVTQAKTKKAPIGVPFFVLFTFGKAGVGFEPHGLRRENRARGLSVTLREGAMRGNLRFF